jgi:hypothetical protein
MRYRLFHHVALTIGGMWPGASDVGLVRLTARD